MASLNPVTLLLPKSKPKAGGSSYTPTFNPNTEVLSAPGYREHLTDLYNSRQVNDARALLNSQFVHDPDISAAVNAYLTISESAQLVVAAYDSDEEPSSEGIKIGRQLLARITGNSDYTLGYVSKPSIHQLCADIRYYLLLRGMCAAELVFDKTFSPDQLRLIDPASLEWKEASSGVYKPVQSVSGRNEGINLDIPTFFTSRFHQNPSSIYSNSHFAAAINTIAARTEVINELFRVLKVTGYPRLDVEVLEDIVANHAPAALKQDPKKLRRFVEDEVARVRSQVNALASSSQALVHSSSVKAKIINERSPSAGLNIDQVVEVLDNQNQAALKVMPAVIGKASGAGGVAGTEARLFAMGCDSLNRVVSDQLSKPLTLAARLAGFDGRIEVRFEPVEMRAVTELNPQLTMKASRLKQDLSLGVITDHEYHLQMYGRPAPDSAPELSGTNFLEQQTVSVNADNITPNDDPLGRSQAPEGGSAPGRDNAARGGDV